MIKRIRKGSVSYQILELLSYSTEISPKLFHRFNDFSYNVYMNEVACMTKMHTYVNDYGDVIENIKVLSVVGKGKHKTIRLRSRAYEEQFLKLLNSDALERYEVNSYHKYQSHYTKTAIERNHMLSEMYCIFRDNDIEDYWFNKDAHSLVRQGGMFLTGQTIKGLYISKAVHHGRSYGALVFENNSHVLYYYENETSLWSSEAEMRSKKMIQKTILERLETYQDKDDAYFDNAIIMSSNIKLAYDVLTGKGVKDDNKRGLRIDEVYRNYRFIPKSHAGEMLTLLKNNIEIMKRLYQKTFGNNPKKSKLIECDGVTAEGSHLLFTFDMNLNRMKRFKKNCDYYSDKKFTVYGFEWQKPLLLKYFNGDNTEIYSVTFETLMDVLELSESEEKREADAV